MESVYLGLLRPLPVPRQIPVALGSWPTVTTLKQEWSPSLRVGTNRPHVSGSSYKKPPLPNGWLDCRHYCPIPQQGSVQSILQFQPKHLKCYYDNILKSSVQFRTSTFTAAAGKCSQPKCPTCQKPKHRMLRCRCTAQTAPQITTGTKLVRYNRCKFRHLPSMCGWTFYGRPREAQKVSTLSTWSSSRA